MGLMYFPIPSEGMLPALVMNTAVSVAGIKNAVRSILQVVGVADYLCSTPQNNEEGFPTPSAARQRRVSITRYDSLCRNRGETSEAPECCVCLCGFEAKETVSELSCKHFFHKGCLDKWFDNHHDTCPLCRCML